MELHHLEQAAMVKNGYADGYVSKEDFAAALRAHQAMQRKVLRGRQQNYTILLLYQNRDSLEKSAVIMYNKEIEENIY